MQQNILRISLAAAALLVSSTDAFVSKGSIPLSIHPSATTMTARRISMPFANIVLLVANDEGDELYEDTSAESGEGQASAPVAAFSSSSPASAAPSPQPARKRLDPLVASLTRMDAETLEAPRIEVPVWGELILDKSLFILLPVAVFAVLGLVTTLYVFANSGDQIVESLAENPILQSSPTPATVDPSACRGLCSDQQANLEGLRTYMNSLRN